ncbi:MAG: hypothetical protein MSIBF_05415 [Candidatus Altiarchaeales archaeon IMC4]|nr:MAG: hypothetical protein MSIBF_05415 [Candidatus Altiarchaeales archaeon IMC4]
MKLEKILDQLNSIEKNRFLVIIEKISGECQNSKEIEKILSDTNKNSIKEADSINIARVFNLIEREFSEQVKEEFKSTTLQLDIVTDIIIRDGNCIMSGEWFYKLYENELKKIEARQKVFQNDIKSDKSDIDETRKRDYNIYKECLNTAYSNDKRANQSEQITSDEQSILVKLSEELGLSQEEIKLINYGIVKPEKLDMNHLIANLKEIGVLFYSKTNNQVFIADEVVMILRRIRGKEVADKFLRRVLKQLSDAQINLVARKHNIDWKQPNEIKIKAIINEGISFSGILLNDIYKEGTSLSEKKKFINQLMEKGLNISPPLGGGKIEEKIQNLVKHFEEIEKDEKVGIAIDGYEKLLLELSENCSKLNDVIKSEFELQDECVLRSDYLLDRNIKPTDILDIVGERDLEKFCKAKSIKTRGDLVFNILDAYKDAEDIELENYVSIASREITALKENGIKLKDSELGIKFEELTKTIFKKLGFKVDEELRKKLNTKKDKLDIVLNLGNNEIIIIECKSVKEKEYTKFSSVSRQIKAYIRLAEKKGFRVINSLLVAPEFSGDFVNECETSEMNIRLIKASDLIDILKAFNETELEQLPPGLWGKNVLINKDMILTALNR